MKSVTLSVNRGFLRVTHVGMCAPNPNYIYTCTRKQTFARLYTYRNDIGQIHEKMNRKQWFIYRNLTHSLVSNVVYSTHTHTHTNSNVWALVKGQCSENIRGDGGR